MVTAKCEFDSQCIGRDYKKEVRGRGRKERGRAESRAMYLPVFVRHPFYTSKRILTLRSFFTKRGYLVSLEIAWDTVNP